MGSNPEPVCVGAVFPDRTARRICASAWVCAGSYGCEQDRLRAYRRKITARAELQQSLAGDLYRNGTGVVLSLQADL